MAEGAGFSAITGVVEVKYAGLNVRIHYGRGLGRYR
jgi:hypothetical protein